MPRDEPEALRLYQLSASHGNKTAQHNVGLYHELGLGGATKDPSLAKHYFTLAAAQGLKSAAEALSKLTEGGDLADEPPPATAHGFVVRCLYE